MSDLTGSKVMESDTKELLKPILAYREATLADCDELAALANSAYLGESSRQGWTNEEALIGGLRTHPSILTNMLQEKNNVILLFFNKIENTLIGCVHLKYNPTERSVWLGMLTVRPDLQGQGYGKFILSTAETYVQDTWNAELIKIRVFIQRPELLEFYGRRGFINTNQRVPFENNHPLISVVKVQGLELAIMQKYVKKS